VRASLPETVPLLRRGLLSPAIVAGSAWAPNQALQEATPHLFADSWL